MNEHPLRRLMRYSRPYRGRFIVALMAMLLYAGASAGVAYLIKPIINNALPGEGPIPFSFWAAMRQQLQLLHALQNWGEKQGEAPLMT